MSSHFSRSSTVASSSTAAPTRIVLVDNTAPTPPPAVPPPTSAPGSADQSRSPSPSPSPSPSSPSLGDGNGSGSGSSKRETLRRAIAERRYKRWSVNPGSGSADTTDGEEDGEDHSNLEQPPDPRADGVVVKRPPGDGASVDGADDPAVATGAAARRGGQQQAGGGGDSSKAGGGTGQLRRKKGGGTEIAEIDVLYENQRGFAIPAALSICSSLTVLQVLRLRHSAVLVQVAAQL